MFQRRSFASACLAGLCGLFGLGRREAEVSAAEAQTSPKKGMFWQRVTDCETGDEQVVVVETRKMTPAEAAEYERWHREHPPVSASEKEVPAIVHELEAFIQDESNRDNPRGLAEILKRHL